MKKDSEKMKKTKFSKYILPLVLLVLVLLMAGLVLTAHRPRRYTPVTVADQNLISPYLTNQLLPTFFNGLQRGEPFEVVITEDGLNDIVSRFSTIKLKDLTLENPQVLLTPQQITLMATVQARPVDLFVTIEMNPAVDQNGLLNLRVKRVELGAVNITLPAKLMGNKAYSDWLALTGTEPNNIDAQVYRSLLNDEPFEPVFEVGGGTLRISNIKVSAKQIDVSLAPVGARQRPVKAKK